MGTLPLVPSIIDAVTDSLQERLSNPRKPWARRLADLLVKNAMSAPIDKLVPLDEAVEMLRNGLHDYVRSDAALRTFSRELDGQLRKLEKLDGTLAEVMPDEVVSALKEWARKPWSPRDESLLKAFDHQPVRELISRLLVQAVADFATAGTAGAPSKRKGAISSFIGSLGQDVGGWLEEHAEDFARHAVSGVLHRVIDELSDPRKAKQQAMLREAIVTGVLSIPSEDIVEELERFDIPGAAKIFRRAIGTWLESPEGARTFTRWTRALLEPHWQRKLAEVVRENGLENVVRTHLPRIVEQRVRAFAESDEFRKFVREVSET
ncbi:MAG: hypothetical protein ACJ790_18510 [Myxococcaceae bacterium]